ncbi:MAG: PilZ domain-containing protein [Nannocystis sp.]|nr:PilZ domain-containing protein [Nannocystis sp.]
MSAQRPQNRRREARHAVNLEVDYAADSTFLYAYITDISSMGIFIRTSEPCPPGTLLRLRFTPPAREGEKKGEALELGGEVKWQSSEPGNPGMGVEFRIKGERTRRRLLEMVRQIAYLSGDDGATEPS